MWKGYDVKRGDFSEAFKQYLRDRGLYFEPSADGSWVHFEVKNADDAVEDFLKQYENRTRYVYEFPDGTTLQDINLAKRLGLKYLGQGKYRKGNRAYFIEGTLAELKNFAYEAFGDYELHPDYLCKADEFAGLDELKSAGYFRDGKYYGKDKQMRLTGSKKKVKDTRGIDSIVGVLQKELQDLAEEAREHEENNYDDYAEGRIEPEAYEKKAQELGAKSTAIQYLLEAYGIEPKIDYGMLGLYSLSYLKDMR